MKRIWWVVLGAIILLTSCSPDASMVTLILLVPTPTLTATSLPLLSTLKPNVLLLVPNQRYEVSITFSDSAPANVSVYEPYPSDKKVIFDLEAQNSDSENVTFALKKEKAIGWGISYVVYALNLQPGRNTPSSHSIQAALMLSLNAENLAFFLCNKYGGREQWCSEPRLWLFDIVSGAARLADFADSGLFFVAQQGFCDDSQTLYGDSCLQYANPYFGYCGMSKAMIWNVASGFLLDTSLPTPANEGVSS
jgi:hypothetical protein